MNRKFMTGDAIRETAAENSKKYRAVLFGGLIAGTLDLTAACVSGGFNNISPTRVMQSVASGWLGAASFTGGATTATLGVLTHFIIAGVWTIIFYTASRRIRFLVNQPIASGIAYGILVYALMYFVIVPLSAAPFKMSVTVQTVITNVLIHIFCVGLPIALSVRRFAK